METGMINTFETAYEDIGATTYKYDYKVVGYSLLDAGCIYKRTTSSFTIADGLSPEISVDYFNEDGSKYLLDHYRRFNY